MNLLNFVSATIENGGASFNLATGEFNPNSGYMVGIKGYEHTIQLTQNPTNLQVEVAKYISKNAVLLAGGIVNNNKFLGSWIHEGKIYLDISIKVDSLEEAINMGYDNGQLAIWDNSNKQEFKLD